MEPCFARIAEWTAKTRIFARDAGVTCAGCAALRPSPPQKRRRARQPLCPRRRDKTAGPKKRGRNIRL